MTDVDDFRKHFLSKDRGDQQIELSLNNKGNVLVCITARHHRVMICWRSRRLDWSQGFIQLLFWIWDDLQYDKKKKNLKVTTQHSVSRGWFPTVEMWQQVLFSYK